MHICFIALDYQPDGAVTTGVVSQTRALANALTAAGHKVHVVALSTRDTSVVKDGITFHQVKRSTLHWYVSKLPLIGKIIALPIREIEYSITAWRGVRRASRCARLDIVEGTETGSVLLALSRHHRPFIIRLHGEEYTFWKHTPGLQLTPALHLARYIQRFALRRAKILISPSATHAHEISTELRQLHPSLAVIPNTTVRGYVDGESGSEMREPIVLYVGRIEKRKGLDLLLCAIGKIKERVPNVRFALAGSFHSTFPKSRFFAQAQQYAICEQLKLLGGLTRQELVKWYERAALVVLPSYYETFGLTVLEAMEHGIPVVVTRGGALGELVEDDVTGSVVPTGDVNTFATAVVDLLENPRKRKAMGQAARDRVTREFSIERILDLNVSCYRKAIASVASPMTESCAVRENSDCTLVS